MEAHNPYRNQHNENNSIKRLIGTIIFVAFVAIIIILIVHSQDQSKSFDDDYTTKTTPTQVKDNTTKEPEEEKTNTPEEASAPSVKPQSNQPQSNTPAPTTQPSPSPNSNTCLHSVSGVCLDDYEDEAYSAGLYDYSYGYYGTSLDYPDNCNNACKEALEDAYDEGWYDSH